MAQYAIGDYSYSHVSEVLTAINHNCEVDGEPLIPVKFFYTKLGWMVECINKEDEPRLERHLNYIYNLKDN